MAMKRLKDLIPKADHRNAKIVVSIVAIFIIAVGIFSIYRVANIFDFTKSLNDVAYTYQDHPVLLKEVAYYIMIEEETVNETALEYDAENPKSYWNLHISQTFVSEEAAKIAREYSIRDQLYSIEAKKAGIKLEKDEISEIQMKAETIAEDMTSKQQRVLQLTQKQIETALTQKALSDHYVIALSEKNHLDKQEKVLSAYYGINSKFFKDLKQKYEVQINKKMWKQISLGDISIN